METTRTSVNVSLIGMIVAVATIGGLLFGYDSGAVNGTQDGLRTAFDLSSGGLGFTVGSLLITEFGTVEATGNGPLDHAESQAWWDWAEARGIGWMAWSIGDRNETSAALKPGTPPAGWSEDDLTESGRLLRRKLRESAGMNPPCQPSQASIR